MPELPPPLPDFITHEPPQNAPTEPAAPPQRRWTIQPLADRANCLIGSAVIFTMVAIGLYSQLQYNARMGRRIQDFIGEEIFLTSLALFVSWLAIWTALSRSRWWVRFLIFAAIAGVSAVMTMITFESPVVRNYWEPFLYFLTIGIVLNVYFSILAFFRLRLASAERLVISNTAKDDFVLVPKKSTAAEIEAYADWHLYRKSAASGLMDAFRPVQFHLRQIFYVSIYIAVVSITLRTVVSFVVKRIEIDDFGEDRIAEMIFQIVCFFVPIAFLLLASAMWISLGKRRWLAKFLALFCVTFVIIFIYKYFSTFGVTDLIVDFQLSYDSIQPIVFAFCVASMWMIVARCFGYRLIRLPLTVHEKNGSQGTLKTETSL
jgi:hypothetical protein